MKFIYKFTIIIIFLLSIVLIQTFKKGFKSEGFKSDYSDYTTIDRIKTHDGDYAYCLAGKVKCPSGSLITINDQYSGGTTYSYDCDSSGTLAECEGNFAYNMKGTQSDWKTPTREIDFPFSDLYKGFTVPYSYVPVEINGKYMNFYDASRNLLDNVNKCDMLLTDSLTDECKASLNPALKPKTESSGKKCVADYGSKKGDPLCCGQTGVLQKWSSEYVCPSSAPTCSGYSCGDKYGTCS